MKPVTRQRRARVSAAPAAARWSLSAALAARGCPLSPRGGMLRDRHGDRIVGMSAALGSWLGYMILKRRKDEVGYSCKFFVKAWGS